MNSCLVSTRVRAQFALAILASVTCLACHAEEPTLGAIKAKGAQTMSKDEMSALLPGARLTREVGSGEVDVSYLKDGSIEARFRSKTRNSGQLRGTGIWRVMDDGKYCTEVKWNRVIEDTKGCRTMYKLGEEYYSAATSNDEEKTYHYTISK
jgi:Protein of unknown function (DUF995)